MEKKIIRLILIFLAIFVPFRELISININNYIKFIPDIVVYGLLVYVLFKNKAKIKLKSYDYLYFLFLLFGLISTVINKVSLLAYALQFRSITTMYILYICLNWSFYLLLQMSLISLLLYHLLMFYQE